MTHEPTIIIRPTRPDAESNQRAERLFARMKAGHRLGAGERAEWRRLYAAVRQASELGGVVRIPTGNRQGRNHYMRRNVLAAAVAAGILTERPRRAGNARRLYSPGKHFSK